MLQNMLNKLRSGRPGGPPVSVAAFGKHPAWDDHIPDLGLDTEQLVQLKADLYLQGIRGNIDAGAWDEKEDDPEAAPRPPFAHVFLRSGREEWIFGRLWSSRDGKGRTRYPMIACVESAGCPARPALDKLFELLEWVQERCGGSGTAAEVVAAIDQARAEARRRLPELAAAGSSAGPEPDPLALLSQRPEMGEGRIGLLRLLYQIQRDMSDLTRGEGEGSRSTTWLSKANAFRGHHLRVPRCADRAVDAVRLWDRFLERQFLKGVPRWVICPLPEPWVDLLVGPVGGTETYRCLRASPRELPLVTDIPYQLDEQFATRTAELLDRAVQGGA